MREFIGVASLLRGGHLEMQVIALRDLSGITTIHDVRMMGIVPARYQANMITLRLYYADSNCQGPCPCILAPTWAPTKPSPPGAGGMGREQPSVCRRNLMETVMGVFASRERAEETVKELLDKRVPQDAIVFLTRSESEAMMLRKSLGALVGGFVGSSAGVTAGVVAATLFSIPGLGQVFALGVGATAALGLAGAAVGKALSATQNLSPSPESTINTPRPIPREKCPEDLAFIVEVLDEDRSLILVRTESQEIAEEAAGILDRMGISSQGQPSGRMQTALRQIGGISVVDVWGGITLGANSTMLREVVSSLLENGRKHVLLNLRGVQYIDSAGLGELVRTHAALQKRGGQLKIVNRNPKVQNLFKATMLHKVFDVHQYEATAIPSFGPWTTQATANGSKP